MSRERGWGVGTLLRGGAILGVSVGVGVAVSSVVVEQYRRGTLVASVPGGSGPATAALGIREWSGWVVDTSVVELAAADLREGRTVLIGLTASDVATCEDLGRQLRRLMRTLAAADQIIALTDEPSSSAVTAFLRSERLPIETQVAYPPAHWPPVAVADGPTPASPFVALADDEGRIGRGVSYDNRFVGVRDPSFVDVLFTTDVK